MISVNLLISNVDSQNQPNQFTANYFVDNSNNATNLWFNSDFTESFPYNVENQTQITLSFNSFLPTTLFDISIGNLSRSSIMDLEIEQNLAFGYWQLPDMFGMIANTSWSISQELFNNLQLNSSSFNEQKDQVLGRQLDIVSVSLDDGFQQTELTYVKANGLLIKASSTVFGFGISISLQDINSDNKFFETFDFGTNLHVSSSNNELSFGISVITLIASALSFYWVCYKF